MREKKLSFVVVFWWALGCLLLGGFLLAFAPKEARESDAENRIYAGFPAFSTQSVLSCDFMTGMESYLSDGFFAREDVIALTNAALGVFDVRSEEDRYLMDQTENEVSELEGEYGDEPEASSEPIARHKEKRSTRRHMKSAPRFQLDNSKTTAAASVFSPNAKYTMWLEQTNGKTTQVYAYSAENMQTFAETLKLYRDALPADGTVHFANVPFSTVANRWVRQRRTFSGWGSNVEDGLQALVGERIYVQNVPAILSPHMDAGEAVYYVTDHHWTGLGAYYVCAEMLKAQGLPVLPYSEYAYEYLDTDRDKNGNIDKIELLYPLQPTHSYIVTHLTEETELDLMGYDVRSYRGYMNNSRKPWRHISTGFHSGRHALVIADSFGNAFAPYLLPYYDDVYMTDLRYGYYSKADAGGSVAELITYFGVDDVYIILSTANSINSKTGLVFLRQYFER